jgi:hypothetical protein
MLSHKQQTISPARLTDEVNYPEAVAEETRSHDDIVTPCELEVAPVFTVEELDFSDYRWGRGDTRSQRELDMYESGHSAKDFF